MPESSDSSDAPKLILSLHDHIDLQAEEALRLLRHVVRPLFLVNGKGLPEFVGTGVLLHRNARPSKSESLTKSMLHRSVRVEGCGNDSRRHASMTRWASASWTAVPNGGQSPFTFTWWVNNAQVQNGTYATLYYTLSGNAILKVSATDAGGATATASLKVTASP